MSESRIKELERRVEALELSGRVDPTKSKLPESKFAISGKISVPPGKTFPCRLAASVPTSILRLTVDPECADHFELESIRYCLTEWVIDGRPVAATFFSRKTCTQCGRQGAEYMFGTRWPTLLAGTEMTVFVTNTSDTEREFRMALECEVAEDAKVQTA